MHGLARLVFRDQPPQLHLCERGTPAAASHWLGEKSIRLARAAASEPSSTARSARLVSATCFVAQPMPTFLACAKSAESAEARSGAWSALTRVGGGDAGVAPSCAIGSPVSRSRTLGRIDDGQSQTLSGTSGSVRSAYHGDRRLIGCRLKSWERRVLSRNAYEAPPWRKGPSSPSTSWPRLISDRAHLAVNLPLS